MVMDHTPEDVGSKPTTGIIPIRSFQNCHAVTTAHHSTTTIHRHGAAAARGAHNSEVTGSKPVAGIFQFTSFTEAGRHSSRDVKT